MRVRTKPMQVLDWIDSESATVTNLDKLYLDNQDWVRNVTSGDYKKWIEKNYAQE
jgi:hypothetical protein